MSSSESYVADVLVIGSEGAGLRAAIESCDKGARTTLVSKGRIGKSGATMLAGADITLDGKSAGKIGLAGNEDDSPEKFFRDIVIQGYYVNNQRLVQAYVRDAPARTKEMIDWGMKYVWDGKRAVISQGIDINRVLVDQIRKRSITVMEDVYITDLLTEGSTVVGAFGLDIKRGIFVVLRSKAVVIATGGWQRAYSFTTAPEGLAGDLHAAAFRAGADLLNMEMVTFCPNAILWPPAFRGDIFPYLLVEIFGDMLDKHAQPYLREYDQRIFKIATTTEWNKLIFSIASTQVVQTGNGSPRGGTYYSLKTVPSNIIDEGERLFPGWKWLKMDYSDLIKWLREGNAVEVAPAAHYMEGGIRVNEFGETTLRGLYAAGECSGGLFGANRVASAITQILVQGAIAGASASEYAKSSKMKEASQEQVRSIEARVTEPFKRKTGIRPIELLKRIRKTADEHLWVIRDGKGLKIAITEIGSIRSELPRIMIQTEPRRCNREWIDAMQIESLVTVLEASARGALMRRESRGVHYRSDNPQTDNDEWLKEIIVRQVGGRPILKTRPVTVTKVKLPKGKFGFEEGIVRAVKALGE